MSKHSIVVWLVLLLTGLVGIMLPIGAVSLQLKDVWMMGVGYVILRRAYEARRDGGVWAHAWVTRSYRVRDQPDRYGLVVMLYAANGVSLMGLGLVVVITA